MKTILIVEEDESVRTPLAIILTKKEFRVLIVQSGEEALRSLTQEMPDLVLSDIGMVGMSGVELAGIINKDFPNLPIILMSGAKEKFTKEIKTVRVQKVLDKPFETDELLTSITQVLAN